MKIKDILQIDVVLTERYWDLEDLAEAVGDQYSYGYIFEDDLNVKLTKHWVDYNLCIDTGVGTGVLHFDGRPFAIETKKFRKSDTNILVFDEEIAKEVRTYLQSLLEFGTMTVHSLDECIDEYL